jgi:RNA polymerase sigma-54 factor
MATRPRLDLRQSQTLAMTPQLQQAIKLLQLSNLELASYVESELEQNPLLERGEADDFVGDGADDGIPGADLGATGDARVAIDGISTVDAEYQNLWSSAGVGDSDGAVLTDSRRSLGGYGDSSAIIEATPAHDIGLRDHLLNQLNVDVLDPVDRVIGVHLIDLLDESGYLADALPPVAERLGCDVDRVEETLARLQSFDPPGIFARSLRECLEIQLRERNRLDSRMEVLLDNLDMLAERRLDDLRRMCGVDPEDFEEMLAEIRSRNPKPGLAFDSDVAMAIVPDVFVRQGPDGAWLVELNSDTLPRVLVNRRYYATFTRQATTKEERKYLVDHLNSANWLVKSLDQRANTILRVAVALVGKQEDFLNHGVRHLRPLILRDIAEEIGMHESTVSRVTVNKYISTPRGTFELRYFFTTAIASTDRAGPAHSSEAVRHRIKTLIEGEESDNVLSDDRLVDMLREEGIDIARRTVAKYRDALRIPSSLDRRRRKKGTR